MIWTTINKPKENFKSKKLKKDLIKLQLLVKSLKSKDIPSYVLIKINNEINEINSFIGTEKSLRLRVEKAQDIILNIVELELEIVAKDHYQSRSMTYGIFIGVFISILLQILGYNNQFGALALGIPMGILAGMAVGKNQDSAAKMKGLQLQF